MALQLRRGTNRQRLQITPAEGELIFVTDYALVTRTGTTIASNLITFSAAHGRVVGDQVRYLGATQNGLTNNNVYFVIADGLTTTALKLSTTSGGAAVTLTNGTGLSLPFALSPTNAAGTPVGTAVTALWIGDGSTVGGVAGNTQALNDLADVTITTPQQGDFLYYTGSQWVNDNVVQATEPAQRPVFEYNNSDNKVNSALILRKDYGASTYGNGDGVGIKFEVKSNTQNTTGDEYGFVGFSRMSMYEGQPVGPNFVVSVSNDDGATWNPAMSVDDVYATFQGRLTVVDPQINIGRDNAAGTNTIINFGNFDPGFNNGQITYDSTNNRFVINRDLQLSTGVIKSSTGATAITVSGTDVTVAGNLTVNGTTTTVNSTTLTVDDKNIELGSVGTPTDTTADGGGITLRGATNKTILWQDANDWWRFNQHIATDSDLYLNADQAAGDVAINFGTTTGLSDKKFYWDNTNSIFRATHSIRSDANLAAAGNVAINRDNSDADATILFYKPTSGTESLIWDRNNTRFAFSNTLAVGGDIRANNSLYLNADQSASDATINFSTSGSLDANTLKWNTSTGRFEFNQTLYSANNIAAAGNIAVNRDASDADAILLFYKPTTGTETIRWNKTTGRFELTTDMYAPQATIGNIDIDRTNGTITTNTGNLTLDSTGGTVSVNDNLNVDSGVFYVDAANNRVGINNPTPNFALDVNGEAWFNNDITVLDSLNLKGNTIVANGGATAITLDGANVTTYGNLTVANDLAVDTNTLYVKSSTNQVAINTLTPAVGYALTVNGSVYSGDAVIANGDFGTNGNNIFFNYDDSGAATSNIVVRRGGGNDIILRWNESTPAWEQTRNSVDFYRLPNQNLDPTDTATFAGATLDAVRVGVTAANEIDTTSGGLTIDSATGTTTVDDNLVVTGGLNVRAGVLFVDPTSNYVGVNDATPTKALDVVGEIRSDTNVLAPKVELNSAATLDAFTTTRTSTSQFTLAETTGDVLKVIIHMSLGTQRHCVEALAMKYGASTAGLTTYAELNTVAGGSPIANFAADVSNGSLRILATPTSSSTTTFKVVRTQIA